MTSLSREFLKALGVADEAITAICERHTEITSDLKAQRDKMKQELDDAKAEAAKVPELQKEIEGLKGGEDWKAKYEQSVKDHDEYVKGIEAKETAEKVKTAYRKLLADEQIKADRIDFVVNHSDLSKMTLDKDGNLEGVDELKKTINDSKDGWGMFKVQTKERKPTLATPPEGGTGTGASRARDIYVKHMKQQGVKIEDTGKE